MQKRIITAFLMILMVLSITTSSLAHSSTDIAVFVDVPANIWYSESVAWAVAQGITTVTSSTTFSPDDTCTNAQVLTFIWRACGEPEPMIDNPFDDITADKYYYKAALWAYAHDMVVGPKFQATKPCTRGMAVTYLWSEAGNPGVPLNFVFSDVSDSAAFAQAVAWAVETGITDGTSDSTFSPEATCTRAQIITFLYRDLIKSDTGDRNLEFEIKPSSELSFDYIEIIL